MVPDLEVLSTCSLEFVIEALVICDEEKGAEEEGKEVVEEEEEEEELAIEGLNKDGEVRREV